MDTFLQPWVVTALLIIALIWGLLTLLGLRHEFTVFEWQRSLLYHHGKLDAVLESGRHVRWGRGYTEEVVEMRMQTQQLGHQEILTQDGLALRISASFNFSVEDPRKAVESTQSYQAAAYNEVHLALRDAVTGLTAEELLAQRKEIGARLTEACAPAFTELGLRLDRIEVRDITFPGELKKMYAAVVLAQKEGLAALERSRAESASLRSLANAAKMLENNPALLQLRTLQAVSEAKSATIVLNNSEPMNLPPTPVEETS